MTELTPAEQTAIAEVRNVMRGKLLTDINELTELRMHLAKAVEDNPPRPVNALVVEE